MNNKQLARELIKIARNMPYVRFENTYNDLYDCYDFLVNSKEPLSHSEEKYKDMLVKLCKEIAKEF